jgi:polyisoprenoid-binding protein YceI
MNRTLQAAFLITLIPLQVVAQTKWQQTSASVSFTIKNRGSNVDGHFGRVTSALVFSPDKLEASSLKGSADVNTISTGIRKRDEDLKGEKYFDAAKHPAIEVASTKLGKRGTTYVGTFNVTIKGVTKQVEIPFEFTGNGNTAEFKGSCTVNRLDYGVGSKGGLAMFLGEDVHVSIDIKARK